MIVNYWAGFITPDIINQHPHIETWAISWLNRAEIADRQGRQLVVFEVPKDELTAIIADIEYGLQTDYGLLPTGLIMPADLV